MTQHKGHIIIDSAAGQGAAFKIYLPRSEQPIDFITIQDDCEEVAGGNETVLLVEDNPMLKRVTARALYEQGYTVLEAANGVEALSVARRHHSGGSIFC